MRSLVVVLTVSVFAIAGVGCSSDPADDNAIKSSMAPGSEDPAGGQSDDIWGNGSADGSEQVEPDYAFFVSSEPPCDEEYRDYGSCSPFCDTSDPGFTCSNVETTRPWCCAHHGEAYDWYPAAGCRTHKPWLSEKIGVYFCQYRGENAPDDGCFGNGAYYCWERDWEEEASIVIITSYFHPLGDESFRACSDELRAQVEAAPNCE
ncbi:MAG: hypothetical protein FWD57_12980 [Polyangiaceae bacterium]|nr:hypothetical protein [Polyangiaceae bacterium]